MYQTLQISQLKPQAIAQRIEEITRLEDDNETLDIKIAGQWYSLCSEEIFLDWLKINYDLSEYSFSSSECMDHRENYVVKSTCYNDDEIMSDYFTMETVKKFINRVDPIFLKLNLA